MIEVGTNTHEANYHDYNMPARALFKRVRIF